MARHRQHGGRRPSPGRSQALSGAHSRSAGGSPRPPASPPTFGRRVALGAVAAGAVVAASTAVATDLAAALRASADAAVAPLAGTASWSGQGGSDARVQMRTPRPILITGSTGQDRVESLVKAERRSAERAAAMAEQARAEQARAEQAARAAREAQEAQEAEARRPRCVRPAAGVITSGYGPRWGTMHAGIDIANRIGTPILAAVDGVVAESGPASGFGLWVRVKHADGTTTVYGHIDRSLVREGQRVEAGQQIATMGNRGESTGPHLHFEVWNAGGVKINPLTWLRANGAQV